MKGCVIMTATEKLKKYIEENYHSVREFTIKIDMPYTTLHSIFRRGIENSSVSNIAKICDALNISLTDLLNNEVKICQAHSSNNNDSVAEIEEALSRKSEIVVEITKELSDEFTLSNGNKLDSSEIKNLAIIIDSSLSRKM